MYTYDNVQLLYKDHLREAKQRHAHDELVRAARGYAQHDNQPGLLERIKLLTIARNDAKQEVPNVRRAPAL